MPGQAQIDAGSFLFGEQGDNTKRPSWALDGSFLAFRQLKQLVPVSKSSATAVAVITFFSRNSRNSFWTTLCPETERLVNKMLSCSVHERLGDGHLEHQVSQNVVESGAYQT